MPKKKKEQEIKFLDNELEAIKQVKEFKETCEANVVAMLWKKPELYYEYDDITLESFVSNKFRVYFTIGNEIILNEGKKILDENTVDIYLEKHKKLQDKYIGYGGFATISAYMDAVKVENMDGYVKEMCKWKVVLELIRNRFPVAHRIKDFADMDIEDVYDEYEAVLNHTFMNITGTSGIKTYDIADGLSDLLASLNEGEQVGLPYHSLEMLTNETNGLSLGQLYIVAATSGSGKSSFVRSTIIPSILEQGEKLLLMINEEDVIKQKKELLVWCCSNIVGKPIQKHILNKGNFDKETWDTLNEAKNWIEEHKNQIVIAAIDSYTTDKAIKLIKKYSSLGIKYMVLDTFKHDSTAKSEALWIEMMVGATKLYDTIKEANKNVCLVCTMQLNKQSTKQRCLTLDNISSAKNTADVASCVIMSRWLLPDEYPNEKNEIKVFKKVGKSKIPVQLNPNKRYQIVFLAKNRYGSANDFSIVMEVDLSTNKYKECGITYITPDY